MYPETNLRRLSDFADPLDEKFQTREALVRKILLLSVELQAAAMECEVPNPSEASELAHGLSIWAKDAAHEIVRSRAIIEKQHAEPAAQPTGMLDPKVVVIS